MVVLYTVAGVNHFINPHFYRKIMPPWLGWHNELIFISGAAEILLALLLLFTPTRRIAAWGIIGLLVAVFPANVQMMFNYNKENNPQLWIAIARLPLQLVLTWWAYRFTKRVI